MDALTLIGYWQSAREPEWPDPGEFVDHCLEQRRAGHFRDLPRRGKSPVDSDGLLHMSLLRPGERLRRTH